MEYGKAEDVVGCHVEDAITFWAQNISCCNDLLKLSRALAEACPRAQAAFGKLDFNKIYGGCFSEDRCWYRCMVQRMINNEKCQVLYIDYGNSEIINRSEIVEIPENLQYPSVAKKYRLWGLRLPADQNLNTFDQGKTFLGSLVFEKAIKVRQKAKQKDDIILVQAECEKVDIGEEVAKAGFAEKCRSPGSTEDVEKREDAMQSQRKKMKAPAQLWVNRPGHVLCNRPRAVLDPVAATARNQVFAGNHMIIPADSIFLSEIAECLEETLHKYIGTKMKDLAANVKLLKEIRYEFDAGFGEQLSQAIKLVTEGNITVPCSLEKLQKLWTEHDLAQEMIQLCKNVDERDELIIKRNEVQQNLYSAVKEFILEVDQLFICERSNILQELSVSLEMIYGQVCEVNDSEEVFQQFLKWKCAKIEEFIDIRNNTDAALQILTDLFSGILKEHDEKEKEIIKSAYSKVMHKVRQEQNLITVIQKTYLTSVEVMSCGDVTGIRNRSLGIRLVFQGYSVDVSSEAKVIERVAKYHRAWDQQKEKSSLLQLLFLLFCKSDPLVYLMVPYYPGASLSAVQADAPLTLEETLKVMKGVAQGLQTLHGANIVHGSLHGNNVFAVNRKQGVVGDFDFTRSEEQRAAADTMVIGTLSLVSPELKMGQPASPASDMYAYGCLLFWVCYGS
uniref:Serine/threonine kinase 31 n=1 Tax=Pavo cristatus TaxID=9049 RepID=A0A8C9L953_PAVCR